MALIVVVVETVRLHGFEHDGDDVVGNDPFVV